MKLTRPVAVAGAALCLPPGRYTADQALACGALTSPVMMATGIQALPVCTTAQEPLELAARAVKLALAQARVDPSAVDLLVYGWVFEQEGWDLPRQVARLGGAESCVALGVRQMSNGGAAALELAARSLEADPGVRTAVAVTADSFQGLPYDRWRSMPPLGDGAAAVVLTRGTGPCALRAAVSVGEPGLELRFPGRDPFAPISVADGTTTAWGDPSVVRGIRRCVAEAITRALAQSGLVPDDPRVAVVRPNRVGQTMVRHLLTARLPRPLRAKVAVPGQYTGHLGAGDLLANLAEFGAPAPGQFHLLVSTGAGLTATAVVIEGISD